MVQHAGDIPVPQSVLFTPSHSTVIRLARKERVFRDVVWQRHKGGVRDCHMIHPCGSTRGVVFFVFLPRYCPYFGVQALDPAGKLRLVVLMCFWCLHLTTALGLSYPLSPEAGVGVRVCGVKLRNEHSHEKKNISPFVIYNSRARSRGESISIAWLTRKELRPMLV